MKLKKLALEFTCTKKLEVHEKRNNAGNAGSNNYYKRMVVGKVAWAVAGAVVTSAILLNPDEESFRQQVEHESKKRTGFIGVCSPHLYHITISQPITHVILFSHLLIFLREN
jgi:hypothetical protein